MKKNHTIACLSLLLLVSAVFAEQVPVKPNILFIAVDDLNDWVSPLKGHPQTITPNFDRLAERGTRFTNAHCPAPLCGPSRASIFTGLHPSTSGIYLHINDEKIKKASEEASASTFLTHYFQKNGYRTMGIGKLLHMGAGDNLLEEYAGEHDFGPKPAKRMKYTPPAGSNTSTDWGAFPELDSEMPDYRKATWIEEKLQGNYEHPFFMAVGFNRPHVPWFVPQKWFDLIDIDSVELPPYLKDDLADAPAISRLIHTMTPTPSTEWMIENDNWKEVVQAYLACVAFVDHQLGRVLDALENSPYAENTIIVLWSDHGYHLGEKNIVAKMTVYEESTRVPLLFAGPGIPKNASCSSPVGLIDLYPTLLELAGLTANPQNEGHSLVPLLKNPDADWEHPALTFWGRNNTTVRTDQYRYIRYEDGSEELYDHATDPNEWINLANDPCQRARCDALGQHIPENQAPLSKVSFFRWNPYWSQKTDEALQRP